MKIAFSQRSHWRTAVRIICGQKPTTRTESLQDPRIGNRKLRTESRKLRTENRELNLTPQKSDLVFAGRNGIQNVASTSTGVPFFEAG